MGSFIGHAVPGSMFIIISIWWFLGILRSTLSQHKTSRHRPLLESRPKISKVAEHRVIFNPSGSITAKIPPEPMAKIALSCIGLLGELLYEKQWVLIDNNDFVDKHLNNYAHASMYCMFGLSGMVDLLVHYRVIRLPQGVDYLFLALAFLTESMLFYFHLDGRPKLSIRVHTFLYMVSLLTAIVLMIEMKASSSIPAISRAFLTSLHGTWFFQVAFMLHGKTPWENTTASIEFVAIAFAWHVFILLSIYLLVLVAYFRFIFKQARHRNENDDLTEEDEIQ